MILKLNKTIKSNNLNIMKKFFIFILFSFLVFGLTACSLPEDDNNVNNNDNNNNNNFMETKRTIEGQEDLAANYSTALMTTNLGAIKFKFYGDDSPMTVNNFLNLAQQGFYDGVIFHRIIKDFMIQGGDPTGTGRGGPGYVFADEINNHKLVKGSLAMANAGPGTNGSQFFIVTAAATPWLDGAHTNFGEVIDGFDVVEKIGNLETDASDKPLQEVRIESIELLP